MERTEKQYDVIFAGNYTKDTIITPAGTRHVDGGGMNYAAHAGKALGLRSANMWWRCCARMGSTVIPSTALTPR